MRISRLPTTFFLALSLASLGVAGCGGAQTEAKTPTTDSAEAPRDGSGTLDPASAIPTSPSSSNEAASPTAKASSTDDGSDILPPGIGRGAKDNGAKDNTKESAAKGSSKKPGIKKKASGKSKKKG